MDQIGEGLIERFFGRVHAYVRVRVPTQDCEDVVGDIFLRAIERREQQRGDAGAWLFSIARTRIADYYRGRREAHMPLEATEEGAAPAAAQHSAAGLERLENAEFNERLRKCLNRLSEQERDVIALKFTDGLSNIEIAGLLNITPNGLGVLLHRALRELRAAMMKEI